MLAVLVIAHPEPDDKFRKWIGQMQIEWMMLQDHDNVDVQHGFWKGLNSQNLCTIFAGEQEEPRKADVALLEDYDLLFGQRFRTSQRDIRPNVHSFSVELDLLVENPSDMMESVEISDEDDGEDENVNVEGPDHGALGTSESIAGGGELAKFTTEEILYIRRALDMAPAGLEDLEKWLLECLCHQWDGDQRKILSSWCSHWEAKARGVDNYQDQILGRSLFLASLQRVKELHKIMTADMTPWSTAFMLLDMLDWDAPHTPEEVGKARNTLSHLVPFQDCEGVHKELCHLLEGASPAVTECVTSLHAQQAVYLYRFTKSSLYYKHWKNVFLLDAIFTRVIVEGSRNPVLDGEEVEWWRNKTDSIISEGTARCLSLTTWQIRALLLPGGLRPVTPTQTRLFRERFCPELDLHSLVDPFELKPQPVKHSTIYPDAVQREHHDLYRLFGTVKEPPGTSSAVLRSHGASPDMASGPASASAAGDATSISATAPGQDLRGGSSRSTSAGLLAPPARFARPAEIAQPPSPRPSSGHASPCRDASPPRGTTTRKRNPFIGKSMFKRACSPHPDERTPKAPSLGRGYITRAEVATDLQGLKTDILQSLSQIRDEFVTGVEQLKRFKTEVLEWQERLTTTQKDEVLAAIRAHQAVTQDSIGPLAMQKEEILTAIQGQRAVIQDALNPLATEKDEILATIRTRDQQAAQDLQTALQGIISRQVGALQQTIKAQDVHDALTRLATTQKEDVLSMEGRVVTKQKDELLAALHSQDSTMRECIQQQTEALQDTIRTQRKAPLPGQDGYLSQCLAPDEWTSSQHDYEAMLLRAAWLYIHILGNPDEGVLADAKAWEDVAERYPVLSSDHFETALNHVHMQAFGRLFKYE